MTKPTHLNPPVPLALENDVPDPTKIPPPFPLEDGIEVPPILRRTIYPFAVMTVGQSFTAPKDQHRKIQSSAQHYGKRLKRTYITRPDPKDPTRVRCWRGEDPKSDEAQA